MLCSITLGGGGGNRAVYDLCEKILNSHTGLGTQCNTAHVLCEQDNYVYKHTLKIYLYVILITFPRQT